MNFPNDIRITELIVNDFEFKKSEITHVPGRIFHGLTYRFFGKISICPENGKKFYSDKSCITYVPKGCSYDTEILEDGRMLTIHFDTDMNCEGLSAFAVKPTYPIVFENLFKALISRYRTVGGRWDYSCVSIAYEIFAEFSHELSSCGQGKIIPRRMREIKAYIDESYGNREISIPMLSEMCGISEVYFRREFRECFGASPLEYIKKVRLENAKGLLATGMYPISEIATRFGFDSISYFSYEFRRKCGESPGGFAKKFIAE